MSKINNFTKYLKQRFNFTHLVLLLIFLVSIIIRFYYFKESTYFGFDEARDAYTSQDVYRTLDIKIIGPPAANYPGIFHGPLFWYLIGPLYLLGKGNPYFVSALFRIINSLGVFIIFIIGKKLFNNSVGLISALIYAVSFELTQYAMYVGNPTLAIFSFLGIFYGVAILEKDNNQRGLLIILASTAIAIQLELILLYTTVLVLILLFLSKDKISKIKIQKWILYLLVVVGLLSTFIAAELKYNFQSSRALLNLLQTGHNVMPVGETRLTLYFKMFIKLFQYNILNIPIIFIIIPLLFIFIVLVKYKKQYPLVKYLLIWIFASIILLPFGGYNALYVNVGIGSGLAVASGFVIYKISKLNKALSYFILVLIVISNLLLVAKQNPYGLIVELKPQPYMSLNDELALISKMYNHANGEEFTVRVTGIPYRIQTTWAYLFNYYGLDKWGYLPYWEGEMVLGYPGHLPPPIKGTTCLRYLIRDPIRGLPEILIKKDVSEENLFSQIVKEEIVGHFLLQTRKAHNECRKIQAIT